MVDCVGCCGVLLCLCADGCRVCVCVLLCVCFVMCGVCVVAMRFGLCCVAFVLCGMCWRVIGECCVCWLGSGCVGCVFVSFVVCT